MGNVSKYFSGKIGFKNDWENAWKYSFKSDYFISNQKKKQQQKTPI